MAKLISKKPIYWHCDCGKTEVKGKQRITIIAMRHAESQHNVLGVVNGDPKRQFHITVKGKKQAVELAKKLKAKDISAIIASQMQRTQDTAAPLAKQKKLKIQIDPRLNDIGTGKLEGINILEFRRLTNNVNKSVKGSETAPHIAKRLKSFLKDVMKYYSGKTITIVSSEVILHSLRQIVAGKESNENIGAHLKNAAPYEFTIQGPVFCKSCGDRCEV